MKKFLFAGAIALLGLSVASCHSDDPNYDDVQPPKVEVAPNTLSGVVTTKQGQPINGATVTAGNKTATTNAEGVYEISDINAGSYTVKASASGMISQETELVVENLNTTQHLTWSVALYKEVVEEANVTVDEGGNGTVESEAIEGNDKGEIKITVNVPANTVPQDTKISIAPIYTEESALITRATRATSERMLIGADVTCSDPNLTLANPLNVSFAVDETVTESVETRQYVNGQWITVDHSIDDNGVVVSTTNFGPIGLFFSVNITETVSSDPLTITPNEWNNLYGSSDMMATEATYTYKVGSEYNARGANSLEALLIERLASIIGPTYVELQGVYPVNKNVPVGTAIALSGKQAKTTVTVTSRNRSASGTSFGTVSVTISSYNRQHNGSGNQ